ncbi:hydrolase 1, exosortase A system-associated [Stakelama saccharophila]|uniref:Hydrolase 1, exosortase A system-associated n=1 Tax=Stakelama saccharophila TaxID=3075605 RepID=A0ABZ0B5Y4_9SPHN|nr:hydrolase 1, exosortase A system-associated [Stakelama sp. W311]WNO52807.1 hydrolase 1, exosortase A system-associated [Stakelama sp. W311]
MRRLIPFDCAGETLFGTLDEGMCEVGLLIVSGGNEIRMGAHRGMATLAQRLSHAGFPCFRFDRRGVGDSSGENRGFEHSREDIAAALREFRRQAPRLRRIVAFGNCDAATALALFHGDLGIDALVLANPWIVETGDDALPPPAAIRARYLERLRDPGAWLRLLRGGVDLRKAWRGIRRLTAERGAGDALGTRFADALATSAAPVTILLAERDNTARAFSAAWGRLADRGLRARIALRRLPSASHSFAPPADKAWLEQQIIAALESAAR